MQGGSGGEGLGFISSRKPDWLKVRAPGGPNYLRVKGLLKDLNLHTVCEEARCPNTGECFGDLTATFLILGDICTRGCSFCAITHGRPAELDPDEPERVARAVLSLGLRHVVITSVSRDDLEDGGAEVFAMTIKRIKELSLQSSIEVLVPDFKGSETALGKVLEAGPDILNHNLETVYRLYPLVRPGSKYGRSLQLLARARRYGPCLLTKSGLILGLGEDWAEILQTMADLRGVSCDLLTLGQYLRPSHEHLPVIKYYHPEEFSELKALGEGMGFRHVESGPLVRSSYHAGWQARAAGRRSRVLA